MYKLMKSFLWYALGKEKMTRKRKKKQNRKKEKGYKCDWTDLWILQADFPIVTSCLFPVSRKAPLMVSMVLPDFGPNVGKISWMTGS